MFQVGDVVTLVLHDHPQYGVCDLIQGQNYIVEGVQDNQLSIRGYPKLLSTERFKLADEKRHRLEELNHKLITLLFEEYNKGYLQGQKDKEAEIKSKLGF